MKTITNKFLNRLFITIITFTMTISMLGFNSLAASGDTTVYITKTGKCYHSSKCSSLSKSKIETTLESASSKYSPCSKCKPPILDSSSETTESKASTSTKSNVKAETKNSSSTKKDTSTTKNTSKSTTKATTSTSTETVSASDTTESSVWIPNKGGTKYHKKSSCSNMDNPSNVSLDDAKAAGFTPCKKCYK